MKRNIGYPLPDGEAYTDEMECAIIYYPAKPEYRQALLGSISFLATWRAWERDADKRGKDAADAWRMALELTMGCWNMACIETLITNQEWMIEWMATHSLDCCQGTTYGDTTIIITVITPFIGDPPEYYGETEIVDWDDWAEHVCFNANLWVDLLIENALVLEEGLLAGGIGMGMLAYALAAIAFIATGGLLAIPVIMLGAASLVGIEASGMFSDAADDLEIARDDIVCAILNGLDVGQAVEDALSSGTAWDLVFSLLNYDTPTAILHEGGGLDSYLSAETSDACDCGEVDPLHGWTSINNPNLNHYDSVGAPACITNTYEVWRDFRRPAGEGLQTGTLTITGSVLNWGNHLAENANCTNASYILSYLKHCFTHDEDISHDCGSADTLILDETDIADTPITKVIPFTYIVAIWNVNIFAIGSRQKWYFGSYNMWTQIVVDSITLEPA